MCDDSDGIYRYVKYRHYRHNYHGMEKMVKNVQISYELFLALIHYHLLDNEKAETEIKKGLEDKVEAMVRRQLYTEYKTAPTEEQKEKARQEYLDRQGITSGFRW